MSYAISLVYITRRSNTEDEWLQTLINNLDDRFELIVVGHTNIINSRFIYIPFWDDGLDELGLISSKKNLGVAISSAKYCLVIHADVYPRIDFVDEATKNLPLPNEHICPVGFYDSDPTIRGLTWCQNMEPRSQPPDRPDDSDMYIGGAAIFSTKLTLMTYPWDNKLRHGQGIGEDLELSIRARANNVKLSCNPNLVVYMYNNQ